MKNWIKKNLGIVVKVGIFLLLLIWMIILMCLKNNKDFCEAYSCGFGRVLGTVLSFISCIIPISLAELSIVACAIITIILLILIFKELKKNNYLKAISKTLNIALIPMGIFSGYFTTSEMQFNRKTLPVPLYEGKVEEEEYYDIIKYFLDDYNYCASQLTFKEDGDIDLKDYSFAKINNLVKKAYEKLKGTELEGYLNSFTPNCKPLMSSNMWTEFQITGVDFGLFGEANINTYQPAAGYPMVMAHEIAHTKGVMREGDANLLAMYVLLQSDEPYLRFSAYYWGFDSILSIAKYSDDKNLHNNLLNEIADEIYANDSHTYYFWKKHNLLEKISDFFNNLYLKGSGEPEGTASYNDTPIVINPVTEKVVTFTIWQRLYLNLYYSNK